MGKIYYIGGSPCSGKSTVGKKIADECGLYYFEADEYMEYAVRKGKAEGKPQCIRQTEVYGDEKWLRDPKSQAMEEVMLYEEIFPYVMEALTSLSSKHNILAEGVVFMPNLMKHEDMEKHGYCCIIPEEQLQIEQYRERTWVWEVLKDSVCKEEAFATWMKRDALFANEICRQAVASGIPLFVSKKCISISKLQKQVKDFFLL